MGKERDEKIVRLYVEDQMHSGQIARIVGLSMPRVLQILNHSGVEMRGRRAVIADEECERSWRAFVADGGTAVHHYPGWHKQNPWAVSVGTLLNRGYNFTAIPNRPRAVSLMRSYDPADVMLPHPPRTKALAVANWLYQNSAESPSAIQRFTGATRVQLMPSKPRGIPGWSLTYWDSLCPDRSGAKFARPMTAGQVPAPHQVPRLPAGAPRVTAAVDRGDALTVQMKARDAVKTVTVSREMAPLLRDQIDRWLAS